ncbi:hypothetical protein H9Q72_008568 [Fusarium xylarioides]|uniref:F-box domain-containing protein n=1 Tax=Fusarium xylarioides TaxID=221167 RepID=A0A9P7HPD0_9HYPO|nr:hypothetical protein H9Q72_008568 [Fusarium xylarioides]
MTSLQETQHRGCADFFSDLPPELRMEILNQTPLQDIRHLITASPALLRIFQRHRASLLRHHLQDLLRIYGNEIIFPFVAFSMNLRVLRAQNKHLTGSELEEKLKPALNSIQSRECIKQPSTGYLNLPILEKAQNLVPELCRAFHTHRERLFFSTLESSSDFSLEKASWQIKFKFIERFLRFDCFCNMLYCRTHFLFGNLTDLKRRFSIPFLHRPPSPGRFSLHPNTIIQTILLGHQDLIRQLHRSLQSSQPNPLERPEGWKQDILTLRKDEFLERGGSQEMCYVLHLAMGGYPRFAMLKSLTAEEFEHYTLEEFYQVVTADPEREECVEQWLTDYDLHWQ